jgi:hypothetical protein
MHRAALLIALVPVTASADSASSSVTVSLNQAGQDLAAQYGQSIDQLIAQAQQGIEDIYQTQHLGELLRAFANTAAFSARGLGADYQADPSTWMIGVAATGALASDVSLGSSHHVVYGAVVNVGAVAGTSLARWGAPRWWLYASGSYEQTTIKALTGSLTSGGLHAQVKAIRGNDAGSVRWTGVDVTTGFELARWDVGEAQNQPIDINFKLHGTDPSDVKVIDLKSTGTLSLIARTYTVPVEVTTGARLWSLLAIYGGGGIDVTTGKSEVTATLSGPMTMNADHLPIGTAVISASGTSHPDTVSVHALAGLELHARHFRMFLQGAIAPADYALTFGMRLVF